MKTLYKLEGAVVRGKNRGRKLGFPTANIALSHDIPDGIYAAEVSIDGKLYQAATFIGAAETFGENEKKAESYIFNFKQNIYGKQITVRLLKKIRGHKKFTSRNELIRQMKKDKVQIRLFFLRLAGSNP